MNLKKIQNNLKDICSDRTVLIIAHRLSTIKDADVIMVIDKGELVEMGSHRDLMQSKECITIYTACRKERIRT